MKQIISVTILILLSLSACLAQNNFSSDCTHSHICCKVHCPCCMSDSLRKFTQLPMPTESAVEAYVNLMNEHKKQNRLEKVFYQNMSACGGALYGYYLNNELVLIEATYEGELGFSSRTFYLNQFQFFKIIYREYVPEWKKYEQKYPVDKFDFDASKMTYTDTVYTISLSNPTIFIKQSENKIVSSEVDKALLQELINCGYEMKRELSTERK